jgi:hypothetical protein
VSEDGGGQADATELAGRYAELMHVGEDVADRKHATGKAITGEVTDAEREYNQRVFGLTYRERRGKDHDQCIILCTAPNDVRVKRCPSCYGKAVPMDIYMSQLDPAPGHAARVARWAGGVIGAAVAAFAEAVMFPFRVGRAHTTALVRDILQEAMSAGLRAEVDGLADILTVAEAIEKQLHDIRNAVERSEEMQRERSQ